MVKSMKKAHYCMKPFRISTPNKLTPKRSLLKREVKKYAVRKES